MSKEEWALSLLHRAVDAREWAAALAWIQQMGLSQEAILQKYYRQLRENAGVLPHLLGR